MKKRIFIAINLPEEIKDRLAEYQLKWATAAELLPVRWTKKENLHITLDFLGYLSEKEILSALEKTKELALRYKPFFINLNRIIYGPSEASLQRASLQKKLFAKKSPRMIWVVGGKVKELNFVPHITLGRIRTLEWRRIEPEERPIVDEEIDLNFEVKSIEVMESKLTKQGAEYTILKSFPLKTEGF